jgi:hypothetical protein
MSNHCRLKWDDNEDEYLDWYDWERKPEADEADESSEASSSASEEKAPVVAAAGYTMVLADGSLIGHRELASYYKQRYAWNKLYDCQ